MSPVSLDLPEAMAELRPRLPDAVSALAERSPYAAVLLSAREGISITVESREEQIDQLPRSAGAVLTSYDGETMRESSVLDSMGSIADRSAALADSFHPQTAAPPAPGPLHRMTSPRPAPCPHRASPCRTNSSAAATCSVV
jgi:hypothetical protein